MTSLEKHALYSILLRLVDEEHVLSPMERRDILNQIVHTACGMTVNEILASTENKRKLLIKRGTKAQNDEYIGLPGEITIDTDECNLRVHDGETPGGIPLARADAETDLNGADYVTEWQTPTAENNYTWYRKYKSGWVEQGGSLIGTSPTVCTISLPVEMADTNYTALAMSQMKNSGTGGYSIGIDTKTTTSFTFRGPTAGNNSSNVPNWYVAGMAALI